MNVKNTLRLVLEYKKAFKNWIYVIVHSFIYIIVKKNLSKADIIKVKIRGGDTLRVPTGLIYFIKELIKNNGRKKGYQFDPIQGIITFPFMDRKMKMKFYENGVSNGEFASFSGDYNFLKPIRGNTIIDIGANIADSSVWFAVNGASKVIALEPYRYSYKMAIKNIEINDLKNNIILLNVGYGPNREIEVEDTKTNVGTVLKEFKGGIKISLQTLETILTCYGEHVSGNLLLKMDCEGCEYNILDEEENTLTRFSKILIEYHNGYESIAEKLKSCGFKVEYTKPHIWYDKETERNLVQGYLYAINEYKTTE